MRKLVFEEIRKSGPLNAFLISVKSDMSVALALYDGDEVHLIYIKQITQNQ